MHVNAIKISLTQAFDCSVAILYCTVIQEALLWQRDCATCC